MATLAITVRAGGAHTFTAVYASDGTFAQGEAQVVVTVTEPVTPAPALDRWVLMLLCALVGASVFWQRRQASR